MHLSCHFGPIFISPSAHGAHAAVFIQSNGDMRVAVHANGGLALEGRELHPAGSGEVPADRPGDEAQGLNDQPTYDDPAVETTAGLGAFPDLDQLGPPGRL